MDLLDLLVHNPLPAVNMTTAALFRSISGADGHVTVLLDEVDTLFPTRSGSAEEMRGVLNGGYKRGAFVLRAGSEGQVVRYGTFAPVALAGLGTLPDTLMSRSIVMSLHRRRSDEPLSRFRRRDVQVEAQELAAGLADWAGRVADNMKVPTLPPKLRDRAAEIWEPLIAVADQAGERWAASARVAAVAAVAGSPQADHRDTILLAAIKTVFDDSGESKIYTSDLLRKLKEQDTLSLPSLKANKLESILSRYGIRPSPFRQGERTGRGYQRSDFEDAWARYLRE